MITAWWVDVFSPCPGSAPVKPHRKIRITLKMLRKWRACDRAVKTLRKAGLLGSFISTDPEENIPLVLRLTALEDRTGYMWQGFMTDWLSKQNRNNEYGFPFSSGDTFTLPQRFAWLADALATERGL